MRVGLKGSLQSAFWFCYDDFVVLLFIYGRSYTIFSEHVPKVLIDKVVKFHGDSVKIYRVIYISIKVWMTFYPRHTVKVQR